MKRWHVQLVKVYHKTAEIEVRAATEQEAIELAEEMLADDDDWSDYDLVDRFVDETSKV